jgi:hypothetical protein
LLVLAGTAAGGYALVVGLRNGVRLRQLWRAVAGVFVSTLMIALGVFTLLS